jgi:Predicted metal-binding protein related to the C-terminal domain of SecA
MGRTYEFYKQNHPDQFSDSEIIRASKLDKTFLDYYLNTLTSRGEEKKFETFCRRIAEKEICPNLIPQTGPTGGGDSKVDSETYPVSDQLSTIWYSGIGVEAIQERWAFAFSAKQEWKSKLYSDIEKIIEVNSQLGRGYSKIYFMSNQFVSDRNRAKAEDDLRQKYSIDVRVLDRNWLIEKVFTKNHINIVVECFEMSDSFVDEIKKGPGDYTKELRRNEIEDALMNYDPSLPKASMIPLALEACYISRSMELSKEITIYNFERALKIINEFGLPIHKTECIYQWAWTLYWWYEDYTNYYIKYCEFEELALSAGNIFEIERLSNLWMNLRSCDMTVNQNYNIEIHATRLLEVLNTYITDQTKPHAAFEARAIKLNISFLLTNDISKENIDGWITEYINLIEESGNHLDFSLSKLAKMITNIPFLENGENYDELFELLVAKLAEREQEITRASLLIKRAIKVSEEKPVIAISYLGRSLIDLYKEESKRELILALSYMASCLENIGCLWAARNYYLYVLALCFTQYEKYGEIHPAIVVSSDSLKMVELQLGRIGYALSSNTWSIISENLYNTEISENKLNEKPEDLFEPILAIAMMKIPYQKLNKAGFLINVLKKQDLYLPEVTLKYMLGHYDEDWLKYYQNNMAEFEDSMEQLYDQPANKQILYTPWFGTEEKAVMQTKVMGCNIILEAENKFICLELGATILALLESFFATGIRKRILIQQETIKILIQYSNDKEFFITVDGNRISDADIAIHCSSYDKINIVEGQNTVADFLQELFPKILAKMVFIDDSEDALEELVEEEKAFDRSFSFINSIFLPMLVFGNDFGVAVYDEEHILQKPTQYQLIRTLPINFKINLEKEVLPSTDSERKLKIIYGDPPIDLKLEKVSHQQMEIESIIDIPLWNNAKWRGVGIFVSPTNQFAPIMGLFFESYNDAQEIFTNWRNKFGSYDVDDEIQIGIIKGIDKKNPCHYRVIITSNMKSSSQRDQVKYIQWVCRLHTMEAKTLINLQMLEDAIKQNNNFQLSLFTMLNGQPEPLWDTAIKKNVSSITIRNAWEVEEDSYLLTGVTPSDEPIIPSGVENAPITKAIEYIRMRSSKKIGRNDPCPCGSGKKYKKCCLDKEIY